MVHARILCLMDEGAKVGTSLIGSKGYSFLIDVDGKRIMFDTGRNGKHLVHNMSVLQVKADSVDAVIISNPTIDHIGGLNNFMTNRKVRVEVYSVPEAWECKRTFGQLISQDNEGGIMKKESGEDWMQITEHLFLSPMINHETKECVLVLRTNEGPVVLSSYSKSGVGDVLRTVKNRFGRVRAFIGGIYMNKLKQPEVNTIASVITDDYLIKEIHLNGCTGMEGIQKMRVATSNDKIKDFFVGDELDYTV